MTTNYMPMSYSPQGMLAGRANASLGEAAVEDPGALGQVEGAIKFATGKASPSWPSSRDHRLRSAIRLSAGPWLLQVQMRSRSPVWVSYRRMDDLHCLLLLAPCSALLPAPSLFWHLTGRGAVSQAQGRVVMLPSVLRAGHAGPQAGKDSRVQGERGRGWMPLGGPPVVEMGSGAPDTAVGLGAMGGIKTANRARQTSTCQNPTTGLHRCSAAGLSRSGWAAC